MNDPKAATIRDTSIAVAAWPMETPLALAPHPAGGFIAGEPRETDAETALITPTGRPTLLLAPYDAASRFDPAVATGGQIDDRTRCFELLKVTDAPQHTDDLCYTSDAGTLDPGTGFSLGPLTSDVGRDAYESAARLAIAYIHAGDAYQINLAHRLTARFSGSPRALFRAILDSAQPRYAAYAELPDGRVVLSASPELFLAFDATTRRVETRPMKGTRHVSADPGELRRSAKDRAELDMITDLMRNDLGRVCAFGSVRVEQPRHIEAHGGSVLQASSVISGTLRAGLGIGDLLGASFPPGSITGAPKVRATQIIRELEHHERGFYCGAIGLIDGAGNALLNVAIRTAVLSAADRDGARTLTYHAGAGLVADSDPTAEWEETLIKADVFQRLATRPEPAARPAAEATA